MQLISRHSISKFKVKVLYTAMAGVASLKQCGILRGDMYLPRSRAIKQANIRQEPYLDEIDKLVALVLDQVIQLLKVLDAPVGLPLDLLELSQLNFLDACTEFNLLHLDTHKATHYIFSFSFNFNFTATVYTAMSSRFSIKLHVHIHELMD